MNLSVGQIFTEARTQNGFFDVPVPDERLVQLYELVKWGPTSLNCSPARFIFVRTPEARRRLVQCMSPGNMEKVRQAPVTAIIGMDLSFHERLPKLFPHRDVKVLFDGNSALTESTAFRNSSLQGAYLIIAARALNLDCGPMSGFDAAKVDEAFWTGTSVRTNFVCALGKGDSSKVFPRSPRLAFDEACAFA